MPNRYKLVLWCATVVFSSLLVVPELHAQRKWTNPCADASTQQEPVCNFLIHTYEEMDDRCGIVPINKIWPVWDLFRKKNDFDVIPHEVLQDVPLALNLGEQNASTAKQNNNSDWVELNMPSLVFLMTSAGAIAGSAPRNSSSVGEASSQDLVAFLKSIEDPRDPNAANTSLIFDPLTPPARLLIDGKSNSLHRLTCANALAASEEGHLKLAVASASQKFSLEANNSTTMQLVYGSFTSPMTFLQEYLHIAYLYETLDFYRRYAQSHGKKYDQSSPPQFISHLQALAVYNTVKDETTTDLNGSGSASYAALLGDVEASASADRKTNSTAAASLFHSIVRNATVDQLLTPEKLKERIRAGDLRFSTKDNGLDSTSYDRKSKTVQASFLLDQLPLNMCTAALWSFKNGTAEYVLRMEALKKDDSPARNAKPRKICTVTVSVPVGEAIQQKAVKGDLYFNFDPTVDGPNATPLKTAYFEAAYSPSAPQLRLISFPAAGSTSADFYYQVLDPKLLDTSIALQGDPPTLQCDGSIIQKPRWNLNYSDSYVDPTTQARVSGTFIHVQYQYQLSDFTPQVQAAPQGCKPSGTIRAADPQGAPVFLDVQM
jgi:hypothetical protein